MNPDVAKKLDVKPMQPLQPFDASDKIPQIELAANALLRECQAAGVPVFLSVCTAARITEEGGQKEQFVEMGTWVLPRNGSEIPMEFSLAQHAMLSNAESLTNPPTKN